MDSPGTEPKRPSLSDAHPTPAILAVRDLLSQYPGVIVSTTASSLDRVDVVLNRFGETWHVTMTREPSKKGSSS
jgi:hypothetical protein